MSPSGEGKMHQTGLYNKLYRLSYTLEVNERIKPRYLNTHDEDNCTHIDNDYFILSKELPTIYNSDTQIKSKYIFSSDICTYIYTYS